MKLFAFAIAIATFSFAPSVFGQQPMEKPQIPPPAGGAVFAERAYQTISARLAGCTLHKQPIYFAPYASCVEVAPCKSRRIGISRS